MDERRTGNGNEHLDEERIGLAADDLEPLGEADRRHLELCAVCRAAVERQRAVSGLMAELGESYRLQAPPGWPAASAIEALARAPERETGWLDRLAGLLHVRPRALATVLGVGLALALVVTGVLVAVQPASEGAGPSPVAVSASDATPVVAVRPASPDAGVAASEAGIVAVAPPVAPPTAPREASSSVVAVAAGRDVSYVMMNVPYDGGTATVLWLSALPAAAAKAVL
ncbi:MAG: hypothetical protein JXB32_15695 [Deltaproteobacteria bacterium]|nr:hypothetical protein [Deltaproteobacteria bacterium]